MRVVIGGTFPMLTAMSLTVQWDLSPASQCHAVRLGGIAGTSAGTHWDQSGLLGTYSPAPRSPDSRAPVGLTPRCHGGL